MKDNIKLNEDIDFNLNFFVHIDFSLLFLVLMFSIPFITLF